jgi:hypothetical protein
VVSRRRNGVVSGLTGEEPEQATTAVAPVRVVYIGGYGRSGSSLLDALLAERLDALSAGELGLLFNWAARGKPCSCGESVTACELWGPTLRSVTSWSGLGLAELAEISTAGEFGQARRRSDWQAIWSRVFEHLRDHHGVELVVDSSKTAGGRVRHELLDTLPTAQLELFVHLHRSAHAAAYSARRGNNFALEDGSVVRGSALEVVRALLGWLRANTSATRFRKGVREAAVVLAYEDFVLDPEGHLNELVSSVRPASATLSAGREHAIAGNRIRRQGWGGQVRVDDEWRVGLPAGWAGLASVIEWAAHLARVVPNRVGRT